MKRDAAMMMNTTRTSVADSTLANHDRVISSRENSRTQAPRKQEQGSRPSKNRRSSEDHPLSTQQQPPQVRAPRYLNGAMHSEPQSIPREPSGSCRLKLSHSTPAQRSHTKQDIENRKIRASALASAGMMTVENGVAMLDQDGDQTSPCQQAQSEHVEIEAANIEALIISSSVHQARLTRETVCVEHATTVASCDQASSHELRPTQQHTPQHHKKQESQIGRPIALVNPDNTCADQGTTQNQEAQNAMPNQVSSLTVGPRAPTALPNQYTRQEIQVKPCQQAQGYTPNCVPPDIQIDWQTIFSDTEDDIERMRAEHLAKQLDKREIQQPPKLMYSDLDEEQQRYICQDLRIREAQATALAAAGVMAAAAGTMQQQKQRQSPHYFQEHLEDTTESMNGIDFGEIFDPIHEQQLLSTMSGTALSTPGTRMATGSTLPCEPNKRKNGQQKLG